MDAVAQLALMTKAKLVFASPDTFLSFPVLSPLSYSPEQLRFGTGGELTAQDLAEMSEFARITNVMPSGVVAPAAPGEPLWEVCGEVLRTAEVAAGTMTAADRARYDAAMAYLYVTPAAGGLPREDGPALRAYRQCRDAWITAVEDYKARQLTATSGGDAAAAARWAGEEEPKLRAVIAEREATWATTGCRDQVEAALQVEQSLGARSPQRLWDDWQSALMAVIDLTTDTAANDFAATGFAPSDVFDGDPWPSFTLTGPEIKALVAQAPPELTAIFGDSAAASEVESVSFEYRSVALTRSWFRPAMFQARFWRLGPDGGELSDGAEPPTGRCPSYVSALVLARNIVVRHRAQPATPAVTAPGNLLLLRPDLVRRLPPTVVVRDHRGGRAQVRDHRAVAPVALANPQWSAARMQVLMRSQAFTKWTTTWTPSTGTWTPSPSTPPPPEPAPEPAPSTDITILAFICKRTRRCPDPDGSLQWPFSPAAPARTHVVVRGDTLAGIANRYYGNRDRWPEIAARNAIADPRSLRVGQRLVVP
jgi:LysM domain